MTDKTKHAMALDALVEAGQRFVQLVEDDTIMVGPKGRQALIECVGMMNRAIALSEHAPPVEVPVSVELALLRYIDSEGCDCCRDIPAHEQAMTELAHLCGWPTHHDGSGVDWRSRLKHLDPTGEQE